MSSFGEWKGDYLDGKKLSFEGLEISFDSEYSFNPSYELYAILYSSGFIGF